MSSSPFLRTQLIRSAQFARNMVTKQPAPSVRALDHTDLGFALDSNGEWMRAKAHGTPVGKTGPRQSGALDQTDLGFALDSNGEWMRAKVTPAGQAAARARARACALALLERGQQGIRPDFATELFHTAAPKKVKTLRMAG